jgi:hypothetical protein
MPGNLRDVFLGGGNVRHTMHWVLFPLQTLPWSEK